MQRRGFLAALGALVIGGMAGRLAGARPEHEHAATARAVYGNSGMRLARGGALQPREFYYVGEGHIEHVWFNQDLIYTSGTETPRGLRFDDVKH